MDGSRLQVVDNGFVGKVRVRVIWSPGYFVSMYSMGSVPWIF